MGLRTVLTLQGVFGVVQSQESSLQVFVVAIVVGPSLQGSEFVVDAFQRAGRERVVGPVEDATKTLAEIESRFSSDEACAEYLVRLGWPEGFVCPVCGGREACRTERLLFHCAGCGRQVSVTAGTLFQGTRKPLSTWLRAMWWGTSQKYGASAKGFQQCLGLGSYQTAWTWLDKLRRAMVRPRRDQLSGLVEVDETFVGGPEEQPGRGAQEPGHHRPTRNADGPWDACEWP